MGEGVGRGGWEGFAVRGVGGEGHEGVGGEVGVGGLGEQVGVGVEEADAVGLAGAVAGFEGLFGECVGFAFGEVEVVHDGGGGGDDAVADLEEADEGRAEVEAAEGRREIEIAVRDVGNVETGFDFVFQVLEDAALGAICLAGGCGFRSALEDSALDSLMSGQHTVYMSLAKAIGRFTKVRSEEGRCVDIPCLGPSEYTGIFVLQLTGKLVDVLVHHSLIDLEASSFWVEVEHPPSDLT